MDGITHDALLGGRLWLRQPASGHRAGTDSVLLAAFCAAEPGDKVADLGAGVGTVGLCIQARVAVSELALFEIVPELAALARANAATLPNIHVIEADVSAKFTLMAKAGAMRDHFDHVVLNPPFHDADRNLTSPDGKRALAHMGDALLLASWLKTAATLLHAKGTISLIHRADRLPMVLSLMAERFGALRVVPVQPKAEGPALRVLVSGRKGTKAPLQLYRPLIMADAAGVSTSEAEAILRDGARLER